MDTFCTYFDKNYIEQGLELIHSLESVYAYGDECGIAVLALDQETIDAIEQSGVQVDIIRLDEITNTKLQSLKDTRSLVEWYWTHSPVFIKECVERYGDVVYIDADTRFFSNPAYEIQHMRERSNIAITPHRFPPGVHWRTATNGIYNLGFAYFNNSVTAVTCLEWWADRCAERCCKGYANRYQHCGEQGYMDMFGELFDAHDITHAGINLAPWNQMQYDYFMKDGNIYVHNGTTPLIMYHFHEGARPGWRLHPFVKKHIYKGLYRYD